MHILTQDTIIQGAPKWKSECPVCLKSGDCYLTYWGLVYRPCRHEINDEDWAGSLAMKMREYLGLTRKQLGERIGLSKGTIKNYEWTKCPKNYLEKLKNLIK